MQYAEASDSGKLAMEEARLLRHQNSFSKRSGLFVSFLALS